MGELKYLRLQRKNVNPKSLDPFWCAVLAKVIAIAYLASLLVVILSPVRFAVIMFPPCPSEGFRSLFHAFFVFLTVINSLVWLAFGHLFYSHFIKKIEIFTTVKEFIHNVKLLVQAYTGDMFVNECDFHLLAKTRGEDPSGPSFPERVTNVIYQRMLELAEQVKEVDFDLADKLANGDDVTAQKNNKALLSKFADACSSFRILPPNLLPVLYAQAKVNVKARRASLGLTVKDTDDETQTTS